MPKQGKAIALANNDIVYLWWTVPKKIPGCLGYSIIRKQKGAKDVVLQGQVAFEKVKRKTKGDREWRGTDEWPIQSYQWKDLFVPEETEVWYEIVPVTGTPGKKLKPMDEHRLTTNKVRATDSLGKFRIIFNRGITSTQGLSDKLVKAEGVANTAALRKHIIDPSSSIRKGLAGEAISAVTEFLERAKNNGTCYCALYELSDAELIDALVARKNDVKVILANADGSRKEAGKTVKIPDGTNKKARAQLKKALPKGALVDRMLKNGHLGHNKYIVHVDKSNKPKAVLTGSMNWTPTGACTQTNNVIIIDDAAVAARYKDHWDRLLMDQAPHQAKKLRDENRVEPPVIKTGTTGTTQVWFSPNTKQQNKPKSAATPVDMQQLFDDLDKAEHGALFLLFNPGKPNFVDRIKDITDKRKAQGKPFYVRGAISDGATAKTYATRVYNDSIRKAPNTVITGIGGVPDLFGQWTKEIAKVGHAVIHDKLVVIDPFGKKPIVYAGSHNLGFKASYSNDENLCIFRHDRALAEAYTTHILDIVNHFNWRNKLQEHYQQHGDLELAFQDLENDDTWQDKYYRGSFLANRDLFFFG